MSLGCLLKQVRQKFFLEILVEMTDGCVFASIQNDFISILYNLYTSHGSQLISNTKFFLSLFGKMNRLEETKSLIMSWK